MRFWGVEARERRVSWRSLVSCDSESEGRLACCAVGPEILVSEVSLKNKKGILGGKGNW